MIVIPSEPDIRLKLLDWYDEHGRDLPWRRTRDPYRVWVSEIMLQQTRVGTVIDYYRRFLDRFPDVSALAAAPLDDVLKIWENLGYYSRARNLSAAARMVAEEHDGLVPGDWDRLIALPGVGPYVAAAVLSMAFGQPFAAVDGNVRRVLARLVALKDPVDRPPAQKQIAELARWLLPPERPGEFNQAWMDLGSAVCTPKKPDCPTCPIQDECRARSAGLQSELPRRTPKKRLPLKHFGAAIIVDRHDRFLAVRRPPHGLLGGLWKWPGGELRETGSWETALIEAVRSEIGLDVRIQSALSLVRHQYTHFKVALHPFIAAPVDRDPSVDYADEHVWEPLPSLERLAWAKADRLVWDQLRGGGPVRK